MLGPEIKSPDSQVITYSPKACWKFIKCRIPSRLEFSNMILYSLERVVCSVFITPWESSWTHSLMMCRAPLQQAWGAQQKQGLEFYVLFRRLCTWSSASNSKNCFIFSKNKPQTSSLPLPTHTLVNAWQLPLSLSWTLKSFAYWSELGHFVKLVTSNKPCPSISVKLSILS